MIRCKKLNGNFIVSNSGMLFSRETVFDVENELLMVESRNWGFLKREKSYNFAEVDQITVDGRSGHDQDEGKKYYYTIELLNSNLNSIWKCQIIDDEELFQKILDELQSIFKSIIERKALNKNSVRCNSCGRVISKVSEHCIYCGVKKSA